MKTFPVEKEQNANTLKPSLTNNLVQNVYIIKIYVIYL